MSRSSNLKIIVTEGLSRCPHRCYLMGVTMQNFKVMARDLNIIRFRWNCIFRVLSSIQTTVKMSSSKFASWKNKCHPVQVSLFQRNPRSQYLHFDQHFMSILRERLLCGSLHWNTNFQSASNGSKLDSIENFTLHFMSGSSKVKMRRLRQTM